MQMTNRVPGWLTPVAWTFLVLSLVSAVVIAVRLRARGGPWTVDDLVWITSALYLGPFALGLHTRSSSARPPAALAGGGASAVAHLIGVPLVLAAGLTIAGLDLWPMILVIGLIAAALLFAHERAQRPTGRPADQVARPSVGRAAAVAAVTVLAFDVGMGGWMLLLHFNAFMPPATEGSFWFLMQVGVLAGLATGWPAVRWLHARHLA